ncbi:rho GTPase-activating protein 18 [Caerostris extrusa]|uniref:Rho GTPase-activating protein 18 n=1 Tax=Caerostris extrusa TaxID=172846 RepID=A0AAV4PB90_CAEEX|nr:rho GTPase-activating protein 18 [Caerostris extrusa]
MEELSHFPHTEEIALNDQHPKEIIQHSEDENITRPKSCFHSWRVLLGIARGGWGEKILTFAQPANDQLAALQRNSNVQIGDLGEKDRNLVRSLAIIEVAALLDTYGLVPTRRRKPNSNLTSSEECKQPDEQLDSALP